MIASDEYHPYCYPIPEIRFDIDALNRSIIEAFSMLDIDPHTLESEYNSHRKTTTMNLTYPDGIVGQDRMFKYRGDSSSVYSDSSKVYGRHLTEADFTEYLEELDGTYLKETMDTVTKYHKETHGTDFIGRCQLIWSSSGHAYRMHRDVHTKHRYHIPVYTDRDVLWMFEKNDRDINLLHMPADGRAWYLNPISVRHTIVHAGIKPRMHILMTSCI